MSMLGSRTPSTDGAITMTARELVDAVQQLQGGGVSCSFRLVDFPGTSDDDLTVRPYQGEWPKVTEVEHFKAEDDLPECVGIRAIDKPGWWYTVTPQTRVTVLKTL